MAYAVSMNRVITFNLPFIAIREDEAGGYFQPTLGEYFCNNRRIFLRRLARCHNEPA